jgi:hypothetical protein
MQSVATYVNEPARGRMLCNVSLAFGELIDCAYERSQYKKDKEGHYKLKKGLFSYG